MCVDIWHSFTTFIPLSPPRVTANQDEGSRGGGMQRAAVQGAEGAAAPAVQHARHLQRRRPPLDRLRVRTALQVLGLRPARLPAGPEAKGRRDSACLLTFGASVTNFETAAGVQIVIESLLRNVHRATCMARACREWCPAGASRTSPT